MSEEQPVKDDAITMYDPKGQPVKIPRQQWIEQVLPASIKATWTVPDALYSVIVMALREEQPAAVADAIEQLVKIDPSPERAAITRGIWQIQSGKGDDAEQTFIAFMRDHGESATALTNLSRIYNDRGDAPKARATLERALALDPNLDHGLAWYISLLRQEGGEASITAMLQRLAQNPASWRPQLFLARDFIAAGQGPAAANVYRQLLAERNLPPDGIVQITGDLGNAGLLDEMVDVVAPYYQVEKHGPYAGMNLMQAMVARNRFVEASLLLPKLKALQNPQFEPFLAEMTKRLAQALGAQTSVPPQNSTTPAPQQQIAAVPLLYPIWMAALNKPDWLVPPPPAGALRIAFFSLADGRASAEADAANPAHPAARLTRSLPMYLADMLHLQGSAATVCVLPVMPQAGPIISRSPWPLAHMLATCPAEFAPDIVICGAITSGARGNKVELHLFKASDKSAIRTIRIPLGPDFTGSGAKALADIFATLAPLGLKEGTLPNSWPLQNSDAHQNALGSLLLQTLASSRLLNPQTPAADTAALDGYFALASENHASPLPVFMAIAGVVAARRYGSPLAQQYSDMLRTLLDETAPRHELIKLLLPIVYRHLNDNQAFDAAEASVRHHPDPVYQAWLQALRAPATATA